MALEQITFNIGAFNDSDAGGNNYFTDTVFEVKNQSDNTFATIYADSSGTTQIPQNGIDNVSNERGECNFYIDDGEFYIEVDSQKKNFNAGISKTDFKNIDEVKAYPKLSKLIGQRITTGEYHAGTGYGGASYDVVSAGSVTPNDIDIIQGVTDSGAAIKIAIIGNCVYASQLGANPDNLNISIEAINSLYNGKGVNMIWDVGGTISESIRWLTGTFSVDFTGSIFISEYEGGGAAWEFAPDDRNITPPVSNSVMVIKGFNLVAGNYVEANHNCDGVHFGRQSDQLYGESSKLHYENPVVRGAFSYNTVFLDQLYINKIDNCYFDGGWNGNVRVITSVNAGENINFHGGVIADAHNDSDTGTNVIIEANANADLYFNGTSIDYGDIQVVMKSGAIFGTIHMENNSSATDVQLIETNNQPISFNMSGGTISTGPLSSPSTPEPASGKEARVDITGSKVQCVLSGISNSLRDKVNTEIVRVNGGATPVVNVISPFYDTSVDKPALVSKFLNRVRNGSFLQNLTTSWQLNGGGGVSIATSSEESYNGDYSMKFTGGSGASYSALQQLALNGHNRYIVQCRFKVTDYTSGEMQLYMIFKDWQGNNVGFRTSTYQANSVSGWTRSADTAPIPYDTHTIEVQIKANNFIGTAYVDDIVLNTI